jgi:hypothetical protein
MGHQRFRQRRPSCPRHNHEPFLPIRSRRRLFKTCFAVGRKPTDPKNEGLVTRQEFVGAGDGTISGSRTIARAYPVLEIAARTTIDK